MNLFIMWTKSTCINKTMTTPLKTAAFLLGSVEKADHQSQVKHECRVNSIQ